MNRFRGLRRAAAGRRAAPLVAAGLLLLALAAFGARWHWVEEAGSAERDGYVAQAESILAGELPRDPYRPALYPLLVAGLALVVGDAFTAARLISNLAAVALAGCAYGLARRLAGGDQGDRSHSAAAAGWWAFALVAVNPNLWTLGQTTATDMSFAALAATSLLAGLAYLEEPGWRPALVAGGALGLAAFTRGNALFLAPALLLGWWLAPRRRPGEAGGRRFAHLAGLGLAALLLLTPHFVLRAAAFGDPFHDENWKNLAWKLDGYPDWSALGRVSHAGPGELLREEAGAVLAGGLAELSRFLGSGLAQLLGTPLHVAALLAGAVAALAWRRRPAAWLLAAAGCFLAGVALVFFTWGRLLLVLVPVAAALTFAPLGGELWRRFGRWAEPLLPRVAGGTATRARRALGTSVAAAGLLLVLLLAVKTFFFRLPAFVDRHPYREVAVARELAAASAPGAVLAGTSPFLGRYLERAYVYVPDAFGEEIVEPERYYRRLRRVIEEAGIDYLIVGRLDLRDRPPALLEEAPPVPWLAAAGGDGRVRVWRVAER